MCSVSARPVMKMTGTLLKAPSRLSLRQVSNPSMPGITASSRTMSGVIWSMMRMAEAPSSATITVIPAASSASVSNRKVSGESSMTSATSRFFGSVIIGVQRFQGCHVLVEVEAVDENTHLGDELGMLGEFAADLVKLDLDAPDIADLPKADQLFHRFQWRPYAAVRLPARQDDLAGGIGPFDLQELADGLQQPRDVDRLHQITVMERLGERPAMCLQRARRYHQDSRLVVAGGAQRLRDFPAVHAGHRDIEQEKIGPAMLGKRQAARTIGCAKQDEAKRGQHLPQEIAMYGIVVGDEDGLARTLIAGDGRLHRRSASRIGYLRQQDLDSEIAADTDGRGHLDVAAHHASEQPADGEPEARSGLRLRDAECAALEGRKDAFEIVSPNARAGVDHLELGDRVAVMHDELHRAGLGEFDRVGQEIDQDLAQPLLVRIDHERQHGRPLEDEIDPLGRGLQAEHADQLIEEIGQPHLVARQIETARLDLGNVENAVDQS